MYVLDFNYHKPETLEEACRILNDCNNGALLAGGTDILVELKKGMRQNDDIISIKNLNELKILSEEKDKIIIGAAVTHNQIKTSQLIKNKLYALSEAASKIGTEQVRNTGTIGGNLCTGASCCDMAPILLAYNASIEIISFSEKKIIPIKNFFIEHHKTSLKKGEILTKIIVPIPSSNMGVSFLKYGLRDAASISVASVGVMIKFDADTCTDSQIAIGAVAPSPKLSYSASKMLIGLTQSDLNDSNILLKISDATVKDALPIDDIRGSADYRRKIVNVLTKRAIKKAMQRISF